MTVDRRPDVEQRLRELHEYYVFQVNEAVAEGREAEIEALVADYPDAAAQLLAS